MKEGDNLDMETSISMSDAGMQRFVREQEKKVPVASSADAIIVLRDLTPAPLIMGPKLFSSWRRVFRWVYNSSKVFSFS